MSSDHNPPQRQQQQQQFGAATTPASGTDGGAVFQFGSGNDPPPPSFSFGTATPSACENGENSSNINPLLVSMSSAPSMSHSSAAAAAPGGFTFFGHDPAMTTTTTSTVAAATNAVVPQHTNHNKNRAAVVLVGTTTMMNNNGPTIENNASTTLCAAANHHPTTATRGSSSSTPFSFFGQPTTVASLTGTATTTTLPFSFGSAQSQALVGGQAPSSSTQSLVHQNTTSPFRGLPPSTAPATVTLPVPGEGGNGNDPFGPATTATTTTTTTSTNQQPQPGDAFSFGSSTTMMMNNHGRPSNSTEIQEAGVAPSAAASLVHPNASVGRSSSSSSVSGFFGHATTTATSLAATPTTTTSTTSNTSPNVVGSSGVGGDGNLVLFYRPGGFGVRPAPPITRRQSANGNSQQPQHSFSNHPIQHHRHHPQRRRQRQNGARSRFGSKPPPTAATAGRGNDDSVQFLAPALPTTSTNHQRQQGGFSFGSPAAVVGSPSRTIHQNATTGSGFSGGGGCGGFSFGGASTATATATGSNAATVHGLSAQSSSNQNRAGGGAGGLFSSGSTTATTWTSNARSDSSTMSRSHQNSDRGVFSIGSAPVAPAAVVVGGYGFGNHYVLAESSNDQTLAHGAGLFGSFGQAPSDFGQHRTTTDGASSYINSTAFSFGSRTPALQESSPSVQNAGSLLFGPVPSGFFGHRDAMVDTAAIGQVASTAAAASFGSSRRAAAFGSSSNIRGEEESGFSFFGQDARRRHLVARLPPTDAAQSNVNSTTTRLSLVGGSSSHGRRDESSSLNRQSDSTIRPIFYGTSTVPADGGDGSASSRGRRAASANTTTADARSTAIATNATASRRRNSSEDAVTGQVLQGPPASDLAYDTVTTDHSGKDDNETCIICLDRTPICIAWPCAHLAFCVQCSREMCYGDRGNKTLVRGQLTCPVCRDDVHYMKRTKRP